ncbi:MAG: hypothetical protein WC329_06515 [Candidatus Omnitrophota bacterium]|jgi:ribosome maturation factor RimP
MEEWGMETRLKALVEEYFSGRGLEIVEYSCRVEGRIFALRIFADRREGGISMDECAGANRELTRVIDAAFEGTGGLDYSLEVSSPGADRPLRTRSDFSRCRGALVHFFLKEPVGGKVEPEGTLKQVCEEYVEAEINGEAINVPFGIINMAKQVLNRNRE